MATCCPTIHNLKLTNHYQRLKCRYIMTNIFSTYDTRPNLKRLASTIFTLIKYHLQPSTDKHYVKISTYEHTHILFPQWENVVYYIFWILWHFYIQYNKILAIKIMNENWNWTEITEKCKYLILITHNSTVLYINWVTRKEPSIKFVQVFIQLPIHT